MGNDERIIADEPIVARPGLSDWRAPVVTEKALRRPQGYRKVMPKGMSEEPVAARSWLRSLGVLLFVSALGAGFYWGIGPLRELLERPLTSVAVEGEFVYVSKTRTMELITAELNEDFLQLDLMRLKQVLETDPWVEYASLGRRWPDTLVVKIVEQKPIARWGNQGFMNQRGEIITLQTETSLLSLPLLQGETTDAGLILRRYEDISRLLRSRGLDVLALKCDAKKSWRMTLSNEVELVLGRDQVMEKVRRFLVVYDQLLQARWADVNTIDVRYTNGVAVAWRTDSTADNDLINPVR